MARISEKALRPRQYVFNRLPMERKKKLEERVKKLLERERITSLSARANVRAVEETQAAKHAERILEGKHKPEPENDHIRALEKELEELRQKKKTLYETLKKALDSDDAKKEHARSNHVTNHHLSVKQETNLTN